MNKNTISVPKYLKLKAKASESGKDKKAFEKYERSIKALGCYSTNLEEMRQLLYVAKHLDEIKWYVKTGEPMARRDALHADGEKTIIANNEQIEYVKYQNALIDADMPTSTKALKKLLAIRAENLKRERKYAARRRSPRSKNAKTTQLDTKTDKERYLDEVEKATNRAIELNLAANDKAWPSFISCEARVRCRQAAEAISG